MNEKFIELNDNFGIVSDDMGNLDFISKRTNEYSFEDILSKENEIEDSKILLSTLNNELDRKKFQLKYGKKFTLFYLVPFLIPIMSYLTGALNLSSIIFAFMLLESLFVGLKITFFGKKSNVINRINFLSVDINKAENIIKELEKELSTIKEKVEYKNNFSSLIASNNNDYSYNYNEIIEPDNSKKYKIKTLKK